MKRLLICLLVAGMLVGSLPQGALAAVLPSLLGPKQRDALNALHLESQALGRLLPPAPLDAATRQTLALLEAGNPLLGQQLAGYEQIDVYHHYDRSGGTGSIGTAGVILVVGLLALLAWSFTLKT